MNTEFNTGFYNKKTGEFTEGPETKKRRHGMSKDTGQEPIGEAYDAGDEIVILGIPPEFPDSVPEDDPRRHNCDVMGCGCVHVLYRFRKSSSPGSAGKEDV